MKKTFVLIACTFVTLFFATQATMAQNADAKSKEIMNLLSSKLNLTQAQTGSVKDLVSTYAGKFTKSNASVASSKGGLKEKVEKEAQTKLGTEFSNELPKLLTSAQAAKYPEIKDQVTSLFTQIK
jgi:hypothetical protein